MKQPIPITLGIQRQIYRKPGSPAAKLANQAKKIEDLRPKILERDNHTCRCCGFKAEQFQEIIFVNGDHMDHRDQNVVTVCHFCHQCFYLDVASQRESGVLVWLPEIAQAELHHIMRALYLARLTQGAMGDAAKKALGILLERREEAKNRLGTDDPMTLGTVMRDFLDPKTYKRRRESLKGIRLLPLDRRIIEMGDGGEKKDRNTFNQMPQILAHWRAKKGPYGQKHVAEWTDLIEKLTNLQ